MKAYILCRQFLDRSDYSKVVVGGVQTYILNLIPIIRSLEIEPVIIQNLGEDKTVMYGDITVCGIIAKNMKDKDVRKAVYNKYNELSKKEDILIYAQDNFVEKKGKGYTIVIQHGIYWDIIQEEKYSAIKTVKRIIDQCLFSYREICKSRIIDKMVCVDYNYINWFRTQARYNTLSYECIPNFSVVPENMCIKESNPVRIIFARRFVSYRGSLLFARAVKKILDKYNNVKVFFAGEGPDKDKIKDILKGYGNVSYLTYDSVEAVKMHSVMDIAVVPTIGSEGTSLSLLEAMAAHCAVICTNVGGMTNIVIDQYNGLMIKPTEADLVYAIEDLIINVEKRNKLADRGYETVKQAFSHEVWSNRWKKVLLDAKSECNSNG